MLTKSDNIKIENPDWIPDKIYIFNCNYAKIGDILILRNCDMVTQK